MSRDKVPTHIRLLYGRFKDIKYLQKALWFKKVITNLKEAKRIRMKELLSLIFFRIGF